LALYWKGPRRKKKWAQLHEKRREKQQRTYVTCVVEKREKRSGERLGRFIFARKNHRGREEHHSPPFRKGKAKKEEGTHASIRFVPPKNTERNGPRVAKKRGG